MGIIVILIPFSIFLGLVGLGAYLWAVRSGQFKDLETPPLRILFNDSPPPTPQEKPPGGEGDLGD